MQHETGSFLAAGGVTIFTQTWRPEAQPRAVVVLSHGYAEHSGRYAHVAAALVDAGYAVLAFDHRGHGRSGGQRALIRSIRVLVHDLTLVRSEAAGRFEGLPQVLLGHSAGAAVVLEHLLDGADKPAALVLSAAYLRNAVPVATPMKMAAPWLARLVPQLPTQRIDATAISRDPEVVQAYDRDPLVFRGKVPAVTGARLLELEERILPKAALIDVDTLILHGTNDRLADVDGSRELASRMPNATLRTFDGLYHEVFNEPEKEDVLAAVIAWLDATLAS